jgi:hypothetical protein
LRPVPPQSGHSFSSEPAAWPDPPQTEQVAKRDRDFGLQVLALHAAPGGTAGAAGAEHVEEVAQVPEAEVAEIEALALEGIELRPEGLVPALVVLATLLGVGEDGEGLGDLLEPLLGCLVAGVHVRVVLARELAVGRLDLLVVGGARNAQDLVIVLLGGHGRTIGSECGGVKFTAG